MGLEMRMSSMYWIMVPCGSFSSQRLFPNIRPKIWGLSQKDGPSKWNCYIGVRIHPFKGKQRLTIWVKWDASLRSSTVNYLASWETWERIYGLGIMGWMGITALLMALSPEAYNTFHLFCFFTGSRWVLLGDWQGTISHAERICQWRVFSPQWDSVSGGTDIFGCIQPF